MIEDSKIIVLYLFEILRATKKFSCHFLIKLRDFEIHVKFQKYEIWLTTLFHFTTKFKSLKYFFNNSTTWKSIIQSVKDKLMFNVRHLQLFIWVLFNWIIFRSSNFWIILKAIKQIIKHWNKSGGVGFFQEFS